MSPIAGYEDWPDHLATRLPAPGTARTLREVLGVPRGPERPPAVTVDEVRVHDSVEVTTCSWHVGFGPRTRAHLLRPAGESGVLPGVLGLHCHGGQKWLGADKLVDLGPDATPEARETWNRNYEGRAAANALARRGFAVLVHDTFSWGSRRFVLDPPPARYTRALAGAERLWRDEGVVASPAMRYDALATLHENTIAKAAGVLGTTFTGMVAHDDLVALDVLAARPDVDSSRLAAFGFSGGGGRALVLAALDERVRGYVVTCMMATFASLMPAYLDAHSWLLHSPGLARAGEWPDLAPPDRPVLVQYALDDELFPADGMRAADARLQSRLAAYRASFRSGPHRFDRQMQDEAWSFLGEVLDVEGVAWRRASSTRS